MFVDVVIMTVNDRAESGAAESDADDTFDEGQDALATVGPPSDHYYRPDLASVHHRGFSAHAGKCAPGVIDLLAPVRERGGLVLELGCGSGFLTRKLVEAGHRVVATDASPAMLELAREHADGAEGFRQLTLPDDPLPEADAIVGVGGALTYMPDEAAVDRGLRAIARAVRPGGLFAIDIYDLEWGVARPIIDTAQVGDDWAIIQRNSLLTQRRFARDITTFVRGDDDGSWRRDDERHENILIDTSQIPAQLAGEGVEVTVESSFGNESLSPGLHVIIGRRPA